MRSSGPKGYQGIGAFAAAGGLAGRKKTRVAVAKIHWATQGQGGAPWRLQGVSDEGPCLEPGLHLGCHARRSPARADDPGRIHP